MRLPARPSYGPVPLALALLVRTLRAASDADLADVLALAKASGVEWNDAQIGEEMAKGNFVLVADLGLDRVISYRFDRATGVLSQPGTVASPPRR